MKKLSFVLSFLLVTYLATAQKNNLFLENNLAVDFNLGVGEQGTLVGVQLSMIQKKSKIGYGIGIFNNRFKQKPPSDYEPSQNILSNALFGKQNDFKISNATYIVYLVKQFNPKNVKFNFGIEGGASIGMYEWFKFTNAMRQGYSFYGPGSNYVVNKNRKGAIGVSLKCTIDFAFNSAFSLQLAANGQFNKYNNFGGLLVGLIKSS